MPTGDNFTHAMHTANSWLADVARSFGTDDRRFAYRALRAWLHALRDRLTVESAAKFAAQLPELLRGVYYDGWNPSGVPVKYGADEYVARFAREARIPAREVPAAATAVARALAGHMSPGQLAETLAQLPESLRTTMGRAGLRETAPAGSGPGSGSGGTGNGSTGERLAALEERIGSLTEALHALAQDLKGDPVSGVSEGGRGSRGARLAEEILVGSQAGRTER
jgi:uncharacterized protein (DUF2267 family)